MSLELKLRRMHGEAFQGFFSDVMERLHGDDFVRVRAVGKHGDKGCDGYLQGSGQVYQCYGKQHDSAISVRYVVTKIDTDYKAAAGKLGAIMKEWHFVHNLFDGTPTEAVEKLEELRKANGHHVFGFIGPPALEARVLQLAEHEIMDLLGPAATAEDARNIQIEEVGILIERVIQDLDNPPVADARPHVVPHDKLEFNRITGAWRNLLEGATRNAPYVQDYVEQHPDPELGKRLAKAFSHRYKDLMAQGLSPNAILTNLYEGVTGVGSVPVEIQVAAQALLAYLFEACDIFEDHPSKVTA